MRVFLLNALITPIPPSQPIEKPATFIVTKIAPERARLIMEGAQIISAIGHESTAKALSLILQYPVEVARRQVFFEVGDVGIALVLKQRLPEGTVITSVEELERIGYELYEIVRVK